MLTKPQLHVRCFYRTRCRSYGYQVGASVHSILLWPLGGFAFVGHSSTPAKDMLVAAAGPATHIPMFFIWLGALGIAAHVVYHGAWQFSLAVPNPQYHFFLAVCAGAAQASSCASQQAAFLLPHACCTQESCMHAMQTPTIPLLPKLLLGMHVAAQPVPHGLQPAAAGLPAGWRQDLCRRDAALPGACQGGSLCHCRAGCCHRGGAHCVGHHPDLLHHSAGEAPATFYILHPRASGCSLIEPVQCHRWAAGCSMPRWGSAQLCTMARKPSIHCSAMRTCLHRSRRRAATRRSCCQRTSRARRPCSMTQARWRSIKMGLNLGMHRKRKPGKSVLVATAAVDCVCMRLLYCRWGEQEDCMLDSPCVMDRCGDKASRYRGISCRTWRLRDKMKACYSGSSS